MKATGALVLVAGLVSACGTVNMDTAALESNAPAVSSSGVMVHVENDQAHAMRIFATRGTMRFLIGEVQARHRADLVLPRMLLDGEGELRLEADPFGSTQFARSEPIKLTGGRHVEWKLSTAGFDRVRVK